MNESSRGVGGLGIAALERSEERESGLCHEAFAEVLIAGSGE